MKVLFNYFVKYEAQQSQTGCLHRGLLQKYFSGVFVCEVSEYIFKVSDLNNVIFCIKHCQIL